MGSVGRSFICLLWTPGSCQYSALYAHQIYTQMKTNWFWFFFFFFEENLYSSGQHFCSTFEETFFFFFYGTWETLLGRGSQHGRWLAALLQWSGWGALIRQQPTQGAGMLITLWGAVWQQAWWLGISHWGYIYTAHIFLLPPHWNTQVVLWVLA